MECSFGYGGAINVDCRLDGAGEVQGLCLHVKIGGNGLLDPCAGVAIAVWVCLCTHLVVQLLVIKQLTHLVYNDAWRCAY